MIEYVAIYLISLTTFVYWYITRNLNHWKDRNVPYPKPVPLFGNLKESTLRRKNIGVIFEEIYNQYPNEKVVGMYRMLTPCLLIRDLEIIRHIMIKDFDMFINRDIVMDTDGLQANLFSAGGDLWRALRTQFTPMFTTAKLKNMMHLMTERGDKFLKYIETLDNTEQEIHGLVQRYTVATIAACAFGLDFDNMEDKLPVLEKIDKLTLTPSIGMTIFLMFPEIFRKLNISPTPKFIHDFFLDLVKQIFTQRSNTPTNRNDFMDLLIKLKNDGQVQSAKKRTDEESKTFLLSDGKIAAQAFVFYVGGYETSATTMSFLLYQLTQNPHIQDKLIAEIDEVIARHNGQVTYDCLSDMVYLDKVFKETLRMHSIVEPLQRCATVDYKVPGTDVVLKAGDIVLISPRGIHYDPKYYPEPEKFDPERFTVENSAHRHPCAYLPFGVGPRNCIGMRFAQTQSRVCIAKLLSKYRVEPSKRTPTKIVYEPMRVIMGPAGGLYMNLVKRR